MNKENVKLEEKKTRRNKVTPKKKNKGKHKKKVLRVVIYITLVVFMLSLLFLIGFGIYKLSTSPKYNITTVTFNGSEKYSYEDLISVIDINDEENLFRISKKDIKNKLQELPYIKKVAVSKNYPNTLEIAIDEYQSYFFAYNNETNKYLRLTKEGVILEECNSEDKSETELIIFGINFNNKIGESVSDIEKTKLESYIEMKETFDLIGIDKEITSVEFKEKNIIITLNHDMNVIMNTEDIEYKFNFLKSILNELSNESGTIDMTIDNPIFKDSLK